MTPDFEDIDLRLAPADTPAERPDPATPRRRRRTAGSRAVLFAGVAGACALGVGFGLWARPAMNERRVAVAAPEPDATPADLAARRLKIVVGDGPAAPVGAPIET
ncbi:MAG: hypothetical protein JSS35_14035, partial [Proteobacteria bacterium]|nr:hypothetical protein [Pseudomonadota bacterium]